MLDTCFETQWKTSLRAPRAIQKSSSKHRGIVHRSTANRSRSNFLPETSFFQHHPLISATLSPPTRKAHTQAYNTFLLSLTYLPHSSSQLDKALSAYIEDNFETDPSSGRRQKMSYIICFLSLASPDLKHCLGLSRRALAGWSKLRPPTPALPVTRSMMLAFAYYFHKVSGSSASTAIALQWCTYMRASEVLSLRASDVALPGDIRVQHIGVDIGGINIEFSKTGPTQFTPIRDQPVITLLRTFLARQAAKASEMLFNISYSRYNNLFREAAAYFGLDSNRFTTHSARIGGALSGYCTGISAQTIALTGRWKSFTSLERYLRNGRAWIIRMDMNTNSQARITKSAANFENLIRQCEAYVSKSPSNQNHTHLARRGLGGKARQPTDVRALPGGEQHCTSAH